MEVCKCKIEKFGLIDKLKCRIVFRGDLHKNAVEKDSWNPHATWASLFVYLGFCAKYMMFPAQIDFVQAYVQTTLKGEKVYVMFPAFWKDLVPDDLKAYMGVPLLLVKALYGYTYSGRLLWEEQSEFLEQQGMQPLDKMPALWKRHLPNQGIHLVLQYSDDFLPACTDPKYHIQFKRAIETQFQAL